MTNPAIKECSNPRCRNTWEMRDEVDARRETCGLCHFEATFGTQPPSSDEVREAYGNHMRSTAGKLEAVERVRVFNLGRETSLTAAVIDPRLHPDSGDRNYRPDNIPGELLGAARDLADYLGGGRVPPETNRHGIPHAHRLGPGPYHAPGARPDLPARRSPAGSPGVHPAEGSPATAQPGH